ncbi:NAD(P) transhydrogenase subunit alpha [Streptomyces sp. H51]|uniref:NAD(P) transhydrogenase subunit alpha n=1 Tax=Streptomyces sp. H51 TaxID=3111770 RepID=UPI002D7818C6|nr:NAD(P) transhydrogenase subunit alpha [Streptomyces sp. H51]
MNNLDLLTAITVFVLSVLVGVEVISKVPATLHTPLMSGSNAVHGIVVIGAMLIAAGSHSWPGYALAFVAMVFGAMNVVGGYAVTDRMLEMFKARPSAGDHTDPKSAAKSGPKSEKARE